MKKESYFKRIKKPIANAQEAKPIKRETTIYFCICLIGFVVFGILAGVISNLSILFYILALVAFIPAAYFAIMLYAMNRVLKRMKNLQCNKCNATLINDENTTWVETARDWQISNGKNKCEGRLYVSVKITCKCPQCGEIKSFTERLCSGKLAVTDYSIADNLVSTQSLVDDYFKNLIHA